MNEEGATKQVVVSCPLCRYFGPNIQAADGSGYCHRHAPATICIGMDPQGHPIMVFNAFPPVQKQAWCGDGEPGISVESVALGQALLDKSNHGGK